MATHDEIICSIVKQMKERGIESVNFPKNFDISADMEETGEPE